MPLNKLLKWQTVFMSIVGMETEPATTKKSDALKTAVLGLVSESGEVASEINLDTRPWKDGTDFTDIKEEVIDVLFFWLETCVTLGMTEDEIIEIYRHKFAKNMARIASRWPDANLAVNKFINDEQVPMHQQRVLLSARIASWGSFLDKFSELVQPEACNGSCPSCPKN